MSKQGSPAPLRRGIVKLWFALDAVVALAPPLYWAADGRTAPIAEIPTALFYFLAVSFCITASLIAAYLLDTSDEGSAA
ncbi:hypothetical protein PMNALOAF_3779 [Methylobacterium adhaesivum]|uniref:Uncharacterized protein n=1 Tax=Methylobacterium adhaesivum TaxID=333297 RepID=A0ABT8BNP3_9HYPH|nr:hypothetical protein [Methylobacterium adhaesivum]MDN3593152.1 hypothetical protein [Methylobacterium adhaesivum]GJD32503.1 hypothetical protein PMNALOAF_3779 [Methylobacterium adhaesivum]